MNSNNIVAQANDKKETEISVVSESKSPAIQKHLPVLDGIRGIAALMVMVFHYLERKQNLLADTPYHSLLQLSALGQTGVDLFFVLSGFLITRILLKAKSKEKFFSVFYARRTIRIAPLYYFYLILIFLILPVLTGDSISEFSQNWYWWVYLQNFAYTFSWPADGPNFYWTLAVEEHFYLVWPLLVYFLPRRQIAIASIVMVVGSFVLRLFMLSKGWDVFYFTLTRLDALSLGALLAVFEPALLTRTVRNRRLFLSLFFFVGVPLGIIFISAGGAGATWVLAVKYPMTALVYTALIGFAVTSLNDSLFRKICESQSLRFLGSISYGLYVYHLLCFQWFDQLSRGEHPFLFMPLAFAFSVLVAYTSFHLFEKPFLKLKRHFQYPESEKSASTPVPEPAKISAS